MRLAWKENSRFAFALVGLVSFDSKTAGQIHEIELVYRDDWSFDWEIMCDVRGIKHVYKWNECHVCVYNASWSLSEKQMHVKRETQGAFCVLNANAKSQTSMKINVICTVCNIFFNSSNALILRINK